MSNCDCIQHTLKCGTPLDPNYSIIGVEKGSNVNIDYTIPSRFSGYVGGSYSLTIYNKETGATITSVSLDNASGSIGISNYIFGSISTRVVIEDRTDPNNIDTISSIGYIIFSQTDSSQPAPTLQGFIPFITKSGATEQIPFYTTGF